VRYVFRVHQVQAGELSAGDYGLLGYPKLLAMAHRNLCTGEEAGFDLSIYWQLNLDNERTASDVCTRNDGADIPLQKSGLKGGDFH
jgi:hypothetical protein